MTEAELINALALPDDSRLDQRVPKKLLVEAGLPSPADKRQVYEGIESIHWLATLKPTTIGVPEYRDEVREYLEIALLSLKLRSGAKASRLIELLHRAVPYPVILLTTQDVKLSMSLAHKRWSQAESAKTVLDSEIISVGDELTSIHQGALLPALALASQPCSTLYHMYGGWFDTLAALQAAMITGIFSLALSREQAATRRQALKEYRRLKAESARLRASATHEKQISRRAELNLELKSLDAACDAARSRL